MADCTYSLESSSDDESSPSPVNDRVSAFLEAYTIPLQHSRLNVDHEDEVFAFWSQNDRSRCNPSSDDPGLVIPDSPDDPSHEIHQKLKELFVNIDNHDYSPDVDHEDEVFAFWSQNDRSRCNPSSDDPGLVIPDSPDDPSHEIHQKLKELFVNIDNHDYSPDVDHEDEVFAFWSQNDRSRCNPSSDDPGLVIPDSPDDPSHEIHQKLKELFVNIDNHDYSPDVDHEDEVFAFWSQNDRSRCNPSSDDPGLVIPDSPDDPSHEIHQKLKELFVNIDNHDYSPDVDHEDEVFAFWSQNDRSRCNPSSDDPGLVIPDSPDDPSHEIHQKLKELFVNIDNHDYSPDVDHEDEVFAFWSQNDRSRCNPSSDDPGLVIPDSPDDPSHEIHQKLKELFVNIDNHDYSPDVDHEDEVFAFWSQNDRSRCNPSSDIHPGLVPHTPDDPSHEIHHKLKQVLIHHMIYDYFDGLIQFWSIVNTGSRCVLATDNQPFVLHLDSGCQEYRLRSHKYKYNIDDPNSNNNNLEGEEDPFIISGAPVINAFRSHFAEIIVDLRVHQGSPLVNSALGCGLMSCFLIPICDDASQSRCVGVLECCAKDLDSVLTSCAFLLYCLKTVGLRMFKVQTDLLYKAIGHLQHKNSEIRRALEIACELHPLTLAQVSINYEDENRMKQMVPLAWTMPIYRNIGLLVDFCNICDMLPVKTMEGLAEKALENYKPHSCRNIYEMSNIEQPATINMTKYSCLVICFKSIPTDDHVDSTDGHVNYVFEFLWTSEEHYETTIKRLILTLTGCLPNFKFACGADIGDVRVIDGGIFSESGIQTVLELFKGNKLSPIPKVFKEGRKRKDGKGKTHEISLTQDEIEQQHGRTMEEAARNLNVSKSTFKRKWKALNIGSWPGPSGGKRKVSNWYKDQSDMNEGDNRVIQAPLVVNVDTLTIKAEYQNDLIKLSLPLSLITFEALEKKIGENLKLNAGSFKIKYCDEEGDWILLVSDENMRDCIKSSRILNSPTIRLRVT